ncbi:hypothetical protein RB195_014026 [Necator americanus]|uniref:Uncharacterized protein n=1 Tax=Necator americanus TaxID=51031 RepID=A0ABR1E108_NECAM
MGNNDYEHDRLVEHLHDYTRKAKSFKTIKRRLSPKTLELIRQRGAARAACNQELTGWRSSLTNSTRRRSVDSQLLAHDLREDAIPEVFPSELRNDTMSLKDRTSSGLDSIKSKHPKKLPPVLMNTLGKLFTRHLLECKVFKQ